MSAPRPLVVIGAGGFGRETLDVVDAVNQAGDRPQFQVLGVLDDSPSERNVIRLARRGVPYLGTINEWLSGSANAAFLIGVGAPEPRQRLDRTVTSAGLESVAVVHPAAVLGSKVEVGPGSVVCAGVQVSTNVVLGRHVQLNPNATVGHDAVLGAFVSVNPGAIVSGECGIGRGALIGAGAVVLEGRRIGRNSVVGAAACVVRDVPDGVTVVGIPATQFYGSTIASSPHHDSSWKDEVDGAS